MLVSFQLFLKPTKRTVLPLPERLTPTTRRVFLDIHVIGIRNLLGLSPIAKPYLQFDCAYHHDGQRQNTQSSRIPSITNPNFLERIVMQVDLPDLPLMVPTLEVCRMRLIDINMILFEYYEITIRYKFYK